MVIIKKTSTIMAKHDNNQTWGTWEELLLACAVHRHGTHSWDSVAGELQKHTSSFRLLTPLACQHKFHELQRRFSRCDAVLDSAVPWLEELRRLRVAELRREVERYDLSIVSLQLKVKRLTEEQDQSLEINKKGKEKSDLQRSAEKGGGEEGNTGDDDSPNKGEEPVADEVSDKENRSINESNSTDPKENGTGNRPKETKVESGPSEAEADRGGSAEGKATGEDSCDGSCNSVAKESAEKSERVELGESVAESKGESSDMQSSASLGRRKQEERGQSGGTKRVSVESQPLVDFLEMLRMHELSCVFERRLKSQETPDYQNLVRQHLDFETVRTRLEEGCYSDCKSKFFRDLLLLLNNAFVFYGKKSKEYHAATELRKLVSKEIALHTGLSRGCSLPPASELPPKTDPEPSHFLPMNTQLSVPLAACRKRSSLTAKTSKTTAPDQKRSQPAALMDEKPVLDLKPQDQSSGKSEENLEMKGIDEKSTSGARKTKKNSKGRSSPNKNENPDAKCSGGSSTENSESKGNQKEKGKITSSKKRNAANFLNRMKRGSPPSKGSVTEEIPKVPVDASDKAKAEESEQNSNINTRSDAQKERNLGTRSSGRRAKEQGNVAKRSRRSLTQPPPAPVSGKRRRGASEKEADSSRHATKRSRK